MARLSSQEKYDIALTLAGEIDPRLSPWSDPKTRTEAANIIATIENRFDIGTPRAFGASKTKNYGSRSDVVKQNSQYSTWNDARSRATARANYTRFKDEIDKVVEDFEKGKVAPTRPDATHYYAPEAMKALTGRPNPAWAPSLDSRMRQGAHVFGAMPSLYGPNAPRPVNYPTPQVERAYLAPTLDSIPVPTMAGLGRDVASRMRGFPETPRPQTASLPASVMDRIAGFSAAPSPMTAYAPSPSMPNRAAAAIEAQMAGVSSSVDRRPSPMPGIQAYSPVAGPAELAAVALSRARTAGIPTPTRAQPNVPTPTARPSFGLSDAVMSRMPDMPATMPSLADMRTKAAPQTAALPASVAERMAGFPAMGSLNDVASYRGTMGQPARSMPANVPAPSPAPRNNIEAAAKQLGAPVTAGFSGATMRGLLGAIENEKPQIQSAPLNAPKADRVISQSAPKAGRVADQQGMIQSRFDNAPMDTPAMTQMLAEPKDYLSDRYGTRAQPASLQARTPTVAPTRANAMQGPQIASRAFAEAPSIGPTPTARPSLTASPRVGPTSVSSFAPVQAPRTAPTVPEPPARTRSIAPRTVNDPIAVADRQTRSLGAPSIPDAPRQTGGLLGAIGNAFGGVSDTMGGFGGVAGGLLGGAIAGPAGAVVGSMVGRAFNGNTGGGNLSQTARSALANGWSGFGPAQSYADFSRSSGGGGNFSGNSAPRGLFGERNDAASSALPGKTTTYSDGRTERDGPSKSSGSGKGKR